MLLQCAVYLVHASIPPWTHEPQQIHRDREIQRNELPFFHNLTNVTYRNQGCLLVKRFDARRFRNFSMLALLCWCLLYVVVNLFHCKMSKASEMQFFVQKGEAVESVWLVGCIAIMSPLHDTETPQSYVVQCTTKGSVNDSLLCPFLAQYDGHV